MNRRLVLLAVVPAFLSGCAGNTMDRQFQPSSRSAVELRAMQVRILDGEVTTTMRGVIATLQDLGYRITKAEPGAGTVSATKLNTVRLTAVVRAGPPGQTIVRANASVLMPGVETQVDAPEFYLQNFFSPLAAMLGREAFAAPTELAVPEAVRPEPANDPTRRPQSPQAPQS